MRTTTRRAGLIALVAAHASLTSAAQTCQSGSNICQPSGATASSLPKTGPELAPLYNDLLAAVKDVPTSSRRRNEGEDLLLMLAARDTPSVCCQSNLACVNVGGFNIAMCYDHFTTNFKLADGSSGVIDTGDFTGADGGMANLLSGTYTAADKSTGNMYAAGAAASYSPTDSAAIPTPYTASGVGSAIPIGQLGGYATFIVTVPGTTDPGTTNPGETAPSTVPGTTRAGTTVSAHTSLVTSQIQGSAAAAATATSSSSKAAAAEFAPKPTGHLVGLIGVAAAALML